jgi:hypothetical protein
MWSSSATAPLVAILIYTAARAGAVASLKRGSSYHAGDQRMLHFDEKNGKSREIPVRLDLEQIISLYISAVGLTTARKETPLFRTAYKKAGQPTKNVMHVIDICRIVKRRLKDVSLPVRLTAFFPCHDHHRSAGTRGAARRRAAPGRPRRPAHHQALRPAGQEDHAQHRRAEFDLTLTEPSLNATHIVYCLFGFPPRFSG